jgi:mRNA-degrading endonuclease RelE of RelBE toxin-antitoxin system
VYEIRVARSVERDLKALPAYQRRRILDAVEHQLTRQPTLPSRHRKRLRGLVPPWTAEPPIWELRVGEYRVFYDVATEADVVYLRAVRRKPPHRTTEEIL